MVYTKLGLDYGILNLGLIKFILIYPILGLVDCFCIFFLCFGLRPIVIWAHFNWRNLWD